MSLAVNAAQALAQRVEPLNVNGGDRKSELYYNSDAVAEERGTRADYLTARIARDRPDILERMKAGDTRTEPRRREVVAALVENFPQAGLTNHERCNEVSNILEELPKS